MPGPNIGVVIGSIRSNSINRKLAKALLRLLPRDYRIDVIGIDALPLYNQDLDDDPPRSVITLKENVIAADALLFVTPEHNRSVTAVLKNSLDWASRPYGKNFWAGKPAAIAGTSVSAIGSAVAQQDLRRILAYLDVPTLGQPEVFIHFTPGLIDDDGRIHDKSTEDFLRHFVSRYQAWVESFVRSKL